MSSSNRKRAHASKAHVKNVILEQQYNVVQQRMAEAKAKFPDTPFMHGIKFWSSLPNIPLGPKFMSYPFDKERFVRYQETSMEKVFEYGIHDEPTLSMPVDLVDVDLYRRAAEVPLSREDELLLEGKGGEAAAAREKKVATDHIDQPYMRRLEYIDAVPTAPSRKRARTPRASSGGRRTRGGHAGPSTAVAPLPLPTLTQCVEESMQAAKRPPVHPKNPSLKPKRVWKVLPDARLGVLKHVLLGFDRHPVPAAKGPFATDGAKAQVDAMVLQAHRVDWATRITPFVHESEDTALTAVKRGRELRAVGDMPAGAADGEEVLRAKMEYSAETLRGTDASGSTLALTWDGEGEVMRFVPVQFKFNLKNLPREDADSRVGNTLVVTRRELVAEDEVRDTDLPASSSQLQESAGSQGAESAASAIEHEDAAGYSAGEGAGNDSLPHDEGDMA